MTLGTFFIYSIMVQIGDTIVSFDLFQEYFCCNFTHCKGACCVEGDAGAPVLMDEVEKLEEALPELDILYMTRVQKERFFNEEDYLRLKDSYILDEAKMKLAKPDMIVLHPLPRVNEISVAVDKDPRAAYFRQVLYAKYMRMALILKLLEGWHHRRQQAQER